MILIPALLIAGFVNAQTKLSAKSVKVSVHGNSTMHEWTSNVTKASVSGEFDVSNGFKIKDAIVKIETKSLKSTKDSDLMDERTYSTLNADKYPTITYDYTNTLSSDTKGNETVIHTNGNLTLAGVTKPVDLFLKADELADGSIEIKGTKKIKMSTFGVKAPTFMMGALKVDDEVTITFDVVLKK